MKLSMEVKDKKYQFQLFFYIDNILLLDLVENTIKIAF